jgi:phasin
MKVSSLCALGGEANQKEFSFETAQQQRANARTRIMVEATTTAKVKTNKPSTSPFEMPKFEMPKFDIPNVEMPAAFREFAERGVAQAKDTYEKMKAAAEEATDLLETTYSTASKGASDYGLKVIEAARVNTNAAFDFVGELMTAKSLSEVIELSSAHTRKHFEALTQQGKELGALAQKVATETAEPIKSVRHTKASPGFGPGFCLSSAGLFSGLAKL